MKPSTRSVYLRAILYLGLAGAAYWTGRWQSDLANADRAALGSRSPARIALAARTAARAKAYAAYLERMKRIKTFLDPHPAADLGIDLAKDLKGGLEKLAKLEPGQKAQDAYKDAFETWAKDPKHAAEAAAAAQALSVSLEQTAALKGVARGWAQGDPKASLDWASSLPSTNAAILKEAMAGATDLNNENRQPALAAQYVDKIQDASLRNQAIHDVGYDWGLSYFIGGSIEDSAAALTWLDQMATSDTYDRAVREIFSQMDHAQAVTILDKVTEPDVRQTEIGLIAYQWSRQNPAAALQWVQTLPDSDQTARDQALQMVIGSMARTDPAAAAAYVQSSPNPAAYEVTAGTIAGGLASYDPQAALAWTNNMPDGDAKNQTLNNVLVKISATDFSSAWQDAANLPDANTAASIMGNLVSSLAKKDPTQATALIGQIPTEAAQLSATSSIATTWAVQDASGFANWVNGLPAGGQHDAAVAAGLKAVQALKLPAPERASLVQSLTQAVQGQPAP